MSPPRPLPQRPWVGVNFWSRAGGPRMWTERYCPRIVREELDVVAAHGCNVTRSFCYWPDFMPAPERLDDEVLARYDDFLDAHRERGLTTIPTFIVGHMSGENWDPAWRDGRDLYRDVWLVGQQAWFVERLGRRWGSHPAVGGWLLTNEMPIYGGPAPAPVVTAWARLLMQALRASGATQPASIGDGVWGVESSGSDNGFSTRALAPLVDFLGPHVYPMTDDPVRQHSVAPLACVLAGGFGRPVVLEEFGVSSDFVADENAAHYYRQVLHASLMAGAEGWLAWNNCDYDGLSDEDPYRHRPFELHFGLTDHTGAPKPALAELARFSELVTGLPATALPAHAAAPETAIVISEYYEVELPFTVQAYRDDIRDVLLQAYVAGREADLRIGVARERDGFDPALRLLLAPSTKALTNPGMDGLRARIAAGATVYLSFFAGSTDNQGGPWLYGLQETFGVRHELRYGLAEPVEGDHVSFTFQRAFGDIAEGERLTFAVGGTDRGRSRLPVRADDAEVIAIDDAGRPALLARAAPGAGHAVLCTYPLEYMAAHTPRVNPEPTWRLYDALASLAGVKRTLRCEDPRVSCLVAGDGDGALASVLNLSGDDVAAVVREGRRERRMRLAPYDVHTHLLSTPNP